MQADVVTALFPRSGAARHERRGHHLLRRLRGLAGGLGGRTLYLHLLQVSESINSTTSSTACFLCALAACLQWSGQYV